MQNLVIIVAAGKGKRVGGECPKQYQLIGGKPMLANTIEVFTSHPDIDAVLVVIAADDNYYPQILNSFQDPSKDPETSSGYAKLLAPVVGGAERQDSVRMGLMAVAGLKPKNVLIHDAARPFVTHQVISNVLENLGKYDAAAPVTIAKDSVRIQGKPVDRHAITFVQTPQGFVYEKILAAHQKIDDLYTDDMQVAEAAGLQLSFVAGDETNIKVTTKADMDSSVSFRTGTGFDVHAFETGTHVTICGVKLPHTHGLKGHSDADVGLHALVDAILGAIGEGDIGEHFPPTDVKWKGVDSVKFVEHALSLVKAKNAEVENVDITIICEEPKLGEFKPEMKSRVAQMLQIKPNCVNIKATTTEKLGFTGRKEGIAAQAVATIKFFS